MIHLVALAGVLGISFSAVFIRLALVSPVTATFYRAAFAIPVLASIWLLTRSRDRRSAADRLLAALSGLFLAADLDFWHESIALIGAGLATVIPNLQIVFVAGAAWLLHGERLTVRAMVIIAIVFMGVGLTSGLVHPDVYGTNPALGVGLGIVAGACYAGFLLMFRASNKSLAPPVGPLLDATIGVLAGALVSAPFDRHFTVALGEPAAVWLLLLALVSQVVGWLCIAQALPRLPAVETSVLLLAQPVFAIAWGILLFGERLSPLQWLGSGMVLGGVATLSGTRLVGE